MVHGNPSLRAGMRNSLLILLRAILLVRGELVRGQANLREICLEEKRTILFEHLRTFLPFGFFPPFRGDYSRLFVSP